MPVAELERDPALVAEWIAEDMTRAADERDARAEAKRLNEMTPEERIADALKEQAAAGLDEMMRQRKR